MALEAVVYSQDPFSYISCKDFPFNNLYLQQEDDRDSLDVKLPQGQEFASITCNGNKSRESDDYNYNEEDLQWPQDDIPYGSTVETENEPPSSDLATGGGRRKRRRTRSSKNKEEIENQRMTHIAVERNRRKLMNEYLAVLRSLMPPSYAHRGDQATIVGGAINYIKELEHLLQSMKPPVKSDQTNTIAMAEIEVTMAESHASVKIYVMKQPRQLLKLVASIQSLRLTLLHLNVTTRDDFVLYSINLKIEEGSQLNTVEDISAALNQIIRRIEEESSFS